jgi:uncharacterized phage infection (PIP) family protein YhgE
MIQKLKTKKDVREEMEREISQYLTGGGAIDEIQQGISGRENNSNLNQTIPFVEGEKQTRTPLNEEVRSLDERKNKKKTAASSPLCRPKKRIIYDDFGEPVREIWE